MKIHTKTLPHEYRLAIFWTLASVIILSLLAYVYAVNLTARNVALRKNLENQTIELSATLAELEFAYIEKKNTITFESALAYGFKETRKPLYVSRQLSSSLSFNTTNR